MFTYLARQHILRHFSAKEGKPCSDAEKGRLDKKQNNNINKKSRERMKNTEATVKLLRKDI